MNSLNDLALGRDDPGASLSFGLQLMWLAILMLMCSRRLSPFAAH